MNLYQYANEPTKFRPYELSEIIIAYLTPRYVTFHDKTNHIALTIDFQLRPPLPTTTFELLLLQIRSLQPMQSWAKCTQIACNKNYSKHDETLLRTLHAEVRILAVYAKCMATSTKSTSQMAAKMLEREQQPAFQWKRMIR